MGIEAGGIVGIVGADDGPEDAKDYKHSPLTSRLLVKNSDPTILVQNVHTLVQFCTNFTYVIFYRNSIFTCFAKTNKYFKKLNISADEQKNFLCP